jgi:hypothetical protein
MATQSAGRAAGGLMCRDMSLCQAVQQPADCLRHCGLFAWAAALFAGFVVVSGRACPRFDSAISAAGTNVAAPPSRVAAQQQREHREPRRALVRLSPLQRPSSRTRAVAPACRCTQQAARCPPLATHGAPNASFRRLKRCKVHRASSAQNKTSTALFPCCTRALHLGLSSP